MPFASLNPSLDRALADKGYLDPTPVQAAVLKAEAVGRDLTVSAQTGSGKTVAYGLALASTLLGEAEQFEAPSAPLALVVAPTRELAMQVQRELIWLFGPAGGRVAASIGGMDARREARVLEDGCHLVVGTPGRIRDHIERGRLDLRLMRGIVLDEADEMLNLGFREDLEFILDATPPERRTLMFSATMPREIATLAKRFQHDALRIDTVDKSQPHGDIEYRALRIAPNELEHAVVNVLRFFEAPGALVFCQTREAVRHLHASLVERGFTAVALSGELSQGERNHALQALRDGRARVCVATDVAARGIDLPGLELVIHADLPSDRETLLHRSGRTGRAGRKGICVLLAPYTRRRKAEALIAQAGVDVSWGTPPSAESVRLADQKRLLHDSVFSELAPNEDVQLAKLLLGEQSAETIACAFVRLFRNRLPAPEDLFDDSVQVERPPREKRERNRPDKRERAQKREEGPTPAGEATVDRSFSPRTQEPMVWFRMNVGRSNKADPKWILPVICRLGHITKNEIGVIKIFENETKFEIAESVAPKFASSVRRLAGEESVHIQPAAGTMQEMRRPSRQADGAPGRSGDGARAGKQSDRQGFGRKKPFAGKSHDAGGADHKPKREFQKPKKRAHGDEQR